VERGLVQKLAIDDFEPDFFNVKIKHDENAGLGLYAPFVI